MYLQLLRSGYILYRSYLCVLPAHSLYLLPCCLPGSFSLLLACLHNAVFCTFLPLFPLLSFENKISAQEIFYYSCTLSFSCQNKKKSGKRFFYYLLSNFILKLITFFTFFSYSDDDRGKSLKPRCACTGVVLWLNNPPRYGHKSEIFISQYANSGKDAYSAFKKASATTKSSGVVILILS